MRRTSTASGPVITCAACGSTAVARATLERATDRATYRQLAAALTAKRPGTGSACPACARATNPTLLSGPGFVSDVEVCGFCEMAWFDAQTYESLPNRDARARPAAEAAGARRELSPEARKAIAQIEVEELAATARSVEHFPTEGWQWALAVIGLPYEVRGPGQVHLPWATLSLAALVTAASLLAFRDLDAAIDAFGLIPAQWTRLGGLTLLTSSLIHAGLFHLLGNLYFLIGAGSRVEDVVGPARFALLFLAADLAASCVHILADPRAELPSVGASGGISGLVVFYALRHPRAVLAMRFRFVIGRIPAWGLLVFWLGLQGIGLIGQLNGFGETSALAHLGGAAAGAAFWLAWRRLDLREPVAI